MKAYKYFLAALLLLPKAVFPNDPNSGFKLADITPKDRFSFHAENVVRGGKSIDLYLVRFAASPNRYKEIHKILF